MPAGWSQSADAAAARDLLRGDPAGHAGQAARDQAGVHRRPAGLEDQDVRPLLGDQLRAGPRQDAQRDLVRHRRRRQEERALVPEQLGRAPLELVDGRDPPGDCSSPTSAAAIAASISGWASSPCRSEGRSRCEPIGQVAGSAPPSGGGTRYGRAAGARRRCVRGSIERRSGTGQVPLTRRSSALRDGASAATPRHLRDTPSGTADPSPRPADASAPSSNALSASAIEAIAARALGVLQDSLRAPRAPCSTSGVYGRAVASGRRRRYRGRVDLDLLDRVARRGEPAYRAAPGLGVGGARRGRLRGDDEPARRAARAARPRGAVLDAGGRARVASRATAR